WHLTKCVVQYAKLEGRDVANDQEQAETDKPLASRSATGIVRIGAAGTMYLQERPCALAHRRDARATWRMSSMFVCPHCGKELDVSPQHPRPPVPWWKYDPGPRANLGCGTLILIAIVVAAASSRNTEPVARLEQE